MASVDPAVVGDSSATSPSSSLDPHAAASTPAGSARAESSSHRLRITCPLVRRSGREPSLSTRGSQHPHGARGDCAPPSDVRASADGSPGVCGYCWEVELSLLPPARQPSSPSLVTSTSTSRASAAGAGAERRGLARAADRARRGATAPRRRGAGRGACWLGDGAVRRGRVAGACSGPGSSRRCRRSRAAGVRSATTPSTARRRSTSAVTPAMRRRRRRERPSWRSISANTPAQPLPLVGRQRRCSVGRRSLTARPPAGRSRRPRHARQAAAGAEEARAHGADGHAAARGRPPRR